MQDPGTHCVMYLFIVLIVISFSCWSGHSVRTGIVILLFTDVSSITETVPGIQQVLMKCWSVECMIA